jgi:1-deoxy-D-xylulose-5-phosphate synthase
VFADSLIAEAKKDAKIVAITAAMPDGTASIASPRNS